jgi:hypothetical protein
MRLKYKAKIKNESLNMKMPNLEKMSAGNTGFY